jgi:hypothetical protein
MTITLKHANKLDLPQDRVEDAIASDIRRERQGDPDFVDADYLDWFVAVNLHVLRRTGLRALDFPDWHFAEAFDEGVSASEAAAQLLAEVGGVFAGAGVR